MARGRSFALSIAAICLLAGACAPLGATRSKSSPSPKPSTAIVLSVLDQAVYLVDPDTGARSEVVPALGDFRSGYAASSPDRATLAYGKGGIYLLDIATGKRRLLVPGTGMSMPAWSPSGQVLAYGDGASLWITPLLQVQPFQIHLPATLAAVAMDWSTDGIAFQGIQRDCARSYLCPTTANSDVWTVQADGTELTRITSIRRALAPKWSPDGERILFVRKFGGDRRELWVVQADGSNPRRLGAAQNVLAADWSSDGNRIVMARRGLEGPTIRLWITNSDGTAARPVPGSFLGTDATLDW
jgi:TolB protein